MLPSQLGDPNVKTFKINWKTRRVVFDRELSPDSARNTDHLASPESMRMHHCATPVSRSGVRSASATRELIRYEDDDLEYEELQPYDTFVGETSEKMRESKEEGGVQDASSSKAKGTEHISLFDSSTGRANRSQAPFRQPRVRMLDVVSAFEDGSDKEQVEAMNELLKLVEGTSEKAANNRAFVTQHHVVFDKVCR
jgi:hypothetical protein